MKARYLAMTLKDLIIRQIEDVHDEQGYRTYQSFLRREDAAQRLQHDNAVLTHCLALQWCN